MGLEAPDDVPPVGLATEVPPAVDEARVEQLDERGEVRVEAVVRRRREEEERVGPAGEDLGEAAALRVVPVARRCRGSRSDGPRR